MNIGFSEKDKTYAITDITEEELILLIHLANIEPSLIAEYYHRNYTKHGQNYDIMREGMELFLEDETIQKLYNATTKDITALKTKFFDLMVDFLRKDTPRPQHERNK